MTGSVRGNAFAILRAACLGGILLALALSVRGQDSSGCASTVREFRSLLGDSAYSTVWTEISMDDGRPLVVSIAERNGALFLEFTKTGAGLWAEISGTICKSGVDFEVRTTREQIHLGPAATWMLGLALTNSGVFTLRRRAPNQLQIETQGWSGRFVPGVIN